jgi:hypothetical protein
VISSQRGERQRRTRDLSSTPYVRVCEGGAGTSQRFLLPDGPTYRRTDSFESATKTGAKRCQAENRTCLFFLSSRDTD